MSSAEAAAECRQVRQSALCKQVAKAKPSPASTAAYPTRWAAKRRHAAAEETKKIFIGLDCFDPLAGPSDLPAAILQKPLNTTALIMAFS
jgi:hypothetical protein